MRSIKRNKDGSLLQGVGSLIALLIILGIGVSVFWNITDDFDATSAEANASMNTTQDIASTVFDLLPYAALILTAAIIIGAVLLLGGKQRL